MEGIAYGTNLWLYTCYSTNQHYGFGNKRILTHKNSFAAFFCHLSSIRAFSPWFRQGWFIKSRHFLMQSSRALRTLYKCFVKPSNLVATKGFIWYLAWDLDFITTIIFVNFERFYDLDSCGIFHPQIAVFSVCYIPKTNVQEIKWMACHKQYLVTCEMIPYYCHRGTPKQIIGKSAIWCLRVVIRRSRIFIRHQKPYMGPTIPSARNVLT